MTINTPGYQMIKEFYGDRRAERSGVLLINHINEGIEILNRYGADDTVKEAYAAHPLFQSNDDLRDNFFLANKLDPLVVLYIMEYRNIANGFLSNQVGTGPNAWGRVEEYARKPLMLSPVVPVNVMLVADKVQNRKDFLKYHQATHARSRELDFYFNLWLSALDISEAKYQELVKDL